MAAVQGATEFLPISSSGHLLLVSELLRGELNLKMAVLLHVGSLFAVLLFVRRSIFRVFKDWKFLVNLVISTIPAAFVGIFFEDLVERMFSSLFLLPLLFAINALVLTLASMKNGDRSLEQMNVQHALLIGLFQAIAVFPGISRSGMALSAALLLGYKREEAVKYAFLMAIPILAGASLLKLKGTSIFMDLSFFVSFLSSLLALFVLRKVVLVGKLKVFASYCLAVAFLVFVLGG
ncbi:undecaprenyl-diphosphate phosphatase [Pseudothermotoga sp.]|uniref:undecaprenyl-diphosphate phosphatase n=1 Tax=Pseudothermotoga sp. TaxID=2033661 RepID=UPI0031F68C0F